MSYERPDPGEQFRLLKESLGSLMFLWVRLEKALALACRTATGRRVGGAFHEHSLAMRAHLDALAQREGGLHPDLADLTHRIDRVRQARNLIVHSLAGVNADPSRGEPPASKARRATAGPSGPRRPN
ncbi:hypothetical protein C8J46_108119 [Sphingomonas sp. PP-F2F-A104-K0414]|uniref:hypothetical protein n=1 Tax=Sphingomonas sp. PP-F2F-A104-K0414 TaxID=2135661 RepID=UPI0010CE1243|nr:hypothetical protein [Sphingomonas sp. PP-F2F-A104-K0414]TCP96741.1 hypothetical protein C8J46_108119 [Sphingomonas sp. PP-F2F-A104-K0414]